MRGMSHEDGRDSARHHETRISLELELDGEGQTQLNTGVGFFDHMLDAMCRFGSSIWSSSARAI